MFVLRARHGGVAVIAEGLRGFVLLRDRGCTVIAEIRPACAPRAGVCRELRVAACGVAGISY